MQLARQHATFVHFARLAFSDLVLQDAYGGERRCLWIASDDATLAQLHVPRTRFIKAENALTVDA